MNKKRVLIINSYYLPGFKSGGPQRTIENIVEYYGDKAEIYILTQNHDMGEADPYPNIINNAWNHVGKANVMYVTTNEFKWKAIKKAYLSFDTILSCGLFDLGTRTLLMIHRLYHRSNKKLYVAPMGVFSKGAYNNSSHWKKVLFISTFKMIGAFKNIIWSFTTQQEAKDAESILKYSIEKNSSSSSIIAEDLPRKVDFDAYRLMTKKYQKSEKTLRLVFISRLCPKKNLLYALKVLNSQFDGIIHFDIYGVKEELDYWNQCEEEIKNMPNNVKVSYRGEIKPIQVLKTFSEFDAFLFPTKGENYGHVIYEAMSVGCIPIISNETPWTDGALVHDLDNMDGFRKEIKMLLETNDADIVNKKMKCIDMAEKALYDSESNSGYNEIFCE